MVRALLCALLLANAPGVEPVEALPPAERDATRARAAFDAGAEAYGAGNYADAIPLFLEAFRHSGRSGPIFSLAQAHRKRYEADGDPRQRQLALYRYQQYLDFDPEGTRRAEADRYIKELLERSELEGPGEAPEPVTRISLNTSTPNAVASIDGGPNIALPETPTVEPGRHRVVISAAGYHPVERTIEAPEGATVTLDVELEVVDAELFVDGPDGSDIWVDGQRLGRTPHKGPVRVKPGTRQVAVARPGRALFVREVDLDPGQRRTVRADLERTGQRKVAFAAMGIGSAAVATSFVLMGFALAAQTEMRRFWADLDEGPLPDDRVEPYRAAQRRRLTLRNWAIGTGAFGAVSIGTGIVLFFTDKPPVASQLQRRRLGAAPILGPDGAGASLRGRF